MVPRVLTFTIRRVEEQRGRWSGAGERPLVADVGPQPPVLVFPVPGASTGTGVSSTCKVSDAMTSAVSALISGAKAVAVAPTQPDMVEVSRLTPSRAKISAWR